MLLCISQIHGLFSDRINACVAKAIREYLDSLNSRRPEMSETLRRLDLAIELGRRSEEEQIPLRKARDAVLFAAEWMRVAVSTFLSSEHIPLMGIRDPGEFRSYFRQRFKGNLDLVIKSADKTVSALPDWAKTAIATAWNVRIDP